MVSKENMQIRGNSLLKTATSKKHGPARFASLVARVTEKAPMKKVKFDSSEASRLSEITASFTEEVPRQTFVREVMDDDIDEESSIFEMSINSGMSSYFGKQNPMIGNERTLNPQPRAAYRLPPPKDGKIAEKKEVSMHKGITFKAPTPMTLDRVEVQRGQERTAPPSSQWKEEDAERQKIAAKEEEKRELRRSTKEKAKKFYAEMQNETGEGFEAHYDEGVLENAPTKRSRMEKFLRKIRPKKPMTENRARAMAKEAILQSKSVVHPPKETTTLVPTQAERKTAEPIPVKQPISVKETISVKEIIPLEEIIAVDDIMPTERIIPVQEIISVEDIIPVEEHTPVEGVHPVQEILPSREAVSRREASSGRENASRREASSRRENIPVDEITMKEKEESISDLESFGKKHFPVKEVRMAGEDSRDDSSMSTLGTQHILERVGPGPLMSRSFQRDNRDPTPTDDLEALARQQMFHPRATPALIDRVDSGNLTEDVHQRANSGARGSKTLKMLANAMCMVPAMGENLHSPRSREEDREVNDDVLNAALAHIKKGVKDGKDYLSATLSKSLSPIDEDLDKSPINEGISGHRENSHYGKSMKGSRSAQLMKLSKSTEKSEVIDLTELASPMSPSTQDGVKGALFSFDDIMEVAASKLTRSKDGDRYLVDDEESPVKDLTPRASGGQSNAPSRQVSAPSRRISAPSRQVSQSSEKVKSMKAEISIRGQDMAGQISPQSSFEVYEHPEGDVVMWSENPVEANEVPAPKDFNGNYTEGLFDLLSTDESFSRGRKKVTFLAEEQDLGISIDQTQESMDGTEQANACMFDLTLGACGKHKASLEQTIQSSLNKMSTRLAEQHGMADGYLSDDGSEERKINPNLGVMCGAVPLYFMYQNRDKVDDSQTAPLASKKNFEYVEIQEDLAALAFKETTESKHDMIGQAACPGTKEEERFVKDIDDDFELVLPQNAPATKSNLLLDKDDAYWDTLSTIASTKDKSAGSVRVPVMRSKPGPIPVEITMTKKPSTSMSISNESQMKQAIGKLSSLMINDRDDSNPEELTKELAAESKEYQPRKASMKSAPSSSTQVGRVDEVDETMSDSVQEKSDEGLQTYDEGLADSQVKNSKVKSPKEDETSADNSDLLLAVTRSEGNDAARMGFTKPNPYPNPEGNDAARMGSSNKAILPSGVESPKENEISRMESSTKASLLSGAESQEEDGIGNETSNLVHVAEKNEGNQEERPPSPEKGKPPATFGWQVRGMSKPFRISQEALQEATAGLRSYLPKSPESSDLKQAYTTLDVYTKRGGRLTSETKSDSIPETSAESTSKTAFANDSIPEPLVESMRKNASANPSRLVPSTASIADNAIVSSPKLEPLAESMGENAFSNPRKLEPPVESMSKNVFANPWKNSNRSVSWGVEEIYEANSPTSNSAGESLSQAAGEALPTEPSDMAASVTKGATSLPAFEHAVLSPTSLSTQSISGTSSSKLSAKDEQELISRTLLLSKQLLSSMALQELGGADNDFVRSLMSFGTEDGKLSLPSPASRNTTSNDVGSTAQSSSSPFVLESVYGARSGSSSFVFDSIHLDGDKTNLHSPTLLMSSGKMNGIRSPPKPDARHAYVDSSRLMRFPESMSRVSQDPPDEIENTQPSASGRSEISPIDVEALFNNYDTLAKDLMQENSKLQDMASEGLNDENMMMTTTMSITSSPPKAMSRLDELRAHRAQAVARLHASPQRQLGNRVPVETSQRKDRLSAYSSSQRGPANPRAYGLAFGHQASSVAAPTAASSPILTSSSRPYADDLETASTHSASSTPSMKARELRRQLDEAIQVSKNIKESQAQLGSELETFKTRFYRKNDALEDHAVRTMGIGGIGM